MQRLTIYIILFAMVAGIWLCRQVAIEQMRHPTEPIVTWAELHR